MQCKRINQYIAQWKRQGYSDDIPDEVPLQLMQLNLAPSYRAIALAIIRNDVSFKSLGFDGPKSDWYSAIKGMEIRSRSAAKNLELF